MRLSRGIVLGFEVGDGRAAGRDAAQASLHGVCEFRRKGSGQCGRLEALVLPRWGVLGEGLGQCYTEAPDVAGGGNIAVAQFRRIVGGRPDNAARVVTRGSDGIAGQFQLIIDNQKVRRFQLTVHQVVVVQGCQDIEGGNEQLRDFVGTEGTPGKDLGEGLLGIFHNDEEIRAPAQLTPTNVEEAQQVGMGQGGGRSPLHELSFRVHRSGRHELDCGIGKVFCRVFGEEYGAMVRAA
jgi:hypothetical protein